MVGIIDDAAEFEPTTPENYPAPKIYKVELPSGARFLLRQPDLFSLIQRGDIPNPLVGIAKESFDQSELLRRATDAGRTVEQQMELEAAEATDEPGPSYEDGLAFIELLVIAAVVKPELSADPPLDSAGTMTADGKLSLQAVSDPDKLWIFNWVNEGMEGFARFPADGAVDPGREDGGTVRAETGGHAGDPGHAGEPVAAGLR